jgi:hypothetical protein
MKLRFLIIVLMFTTVNAGTPTRYVPINFFLSCKELAKKQEQKLDLLKSKIKEEIAELKAKKNID